MCYIPNVRDRACLFINEVHTRKIEERCVFCKRTRIKSSLYRTGNEKGDPSVRWNRRYRTPCPALHSPGRVVVEPNVPPGPPWQLTQEISVESAPGMMVTAVIINDHEGQGET